MIASAKMGMDFVACAPKKYFPNAELVAQCEEYAKAVSYTHLENPVLLISLSLFYF